MPAAWRFERRGRALDFGRPPEHDLREIMNAILYVDRTGVQWRYLPHDFPHWNTVYGYFAKWQQEGVFAQLNGLLRQLLRQQEGRDAEPSACVIDAQSVKTSTSVPASSQGTDAGKRIVGRKRSIVTDTIGLLLAVLVTAASVQDSVAGSQLLDQFAAGYPGIRKVWVDGGYRQHLVEYAATLGIDMEITARTPGTRGFIFLRWTANSFLYAGVGSLGGTLIALATGYGLARFDFPGRGAVFACVVGSFLVPIALLTLPLYLLFSKIGLVDTPWAMLIPCLINPFSVYLAKVYTDTWNAFFLPLTVLRGEENWTLNLGLYNWSGKRLESGVDLTSPVLTGALLSIVPMAVMMVGMRRYWRTGVTLGALK